MTPDTTNKPGTRNANAKPESKRRSFTKRQREYLANLPNGALFTSVRLAEMLESDSE